LKDQYFGDINDYLKYGILRCLANAGLSVGVFWMLTDDDENKLDGRKIDYLREGNGWRHHDPVLFDKLADAVLVAQARDTRQVEDAGILPGTKFYRRLVPRMPRDRTSWFDEGLAALAPSSLLFFDPDNGLEVPSKRPSTSGYVKYLAWDEVERAWTAGEATGSPNPSLLIFQHFNHIEKRVEFVPRLADLLLKYAPGSTVVALATGNVLFLLAVQPGHVQACVRAQELLRQRWHGQVRISGGDAP